MQEKRAVEIIDGIFKKDTKVLDFVYENFFHQIKALINQNNGTDEDARDIYQDAIMVIYQKVKKDDLSLNCSFGTYLYSVCRLLWLKQLEKKKLNKLFVEDSVMFVELAEDEILNADDLNERYKLYQDHFKRLSYNCQKILELFLAKIPLKEIARILGLKSDQYVKKRKHQCKEKLVASIKSDPRYGECVIK